MKVKLFSWSVLINVRFFQAPVASYSSTTLLMESASKITWFVLLTSLVKDPAGLCATWNQTASVTTLTESQGNVSWITPPQEKERKIWSRIFQVMYTVELRYAKFYKLWNFVKKNEILLVWIEDCLRVLQLWSERTVGWLNWCGFLAFSMERRCSPNLSLSWRLVSPMYCMLH